MSQDLPIFQASLLHLGPVHTSSSAVLCISSMKGTGSTAMLPCSQWDCLHQNASSALRKNSACRIFQLQEASWDALQWTSAVNCAGMHWRWYKPVLNSTLYSEEFVVQLCQNCYFVFNLSTMSLFYTWLKIWTIYTISLHTIMGKYVYFFHLGSCCFIRKGQTICYNYIIITKLKSLWRIFFFNFY